MKVHFWVSFFIFVFVCLLLAFLAGFSLTKIRSAESEQIVLKRTLKLESLLYLEQLNKKLDFLIAEGKRIQKGEKILSDSPFLALVVLDPSQEEKTYIAEDRLKPDIMNQKQEASAAEEQTEKKSSLTLEKKGNPVDEIQIDLEQEKRKAFIKFSKEAIIDTVDRGFWFQSLKAVGQKQSVIAFVSSLDGGDRQWVAFLKKDKKFFNLPSSFVQGRKDKNKEVFVINSQGRLFFHINHQKIFKNLTKKSPVWKFLGELSKQPVLKGKYLTLHKKGGDKNLFYIKKWDNGNLFFISKAEFFFPLFVFGDSYLLVSSVCFFICFLLAVFFFLKLFRFVSAYNFLKQAILSFDKSNLFPVTDVPKNPLLYFYSNRRLFLNKRREENQDSKIESKSLNFQGLVRQELEKLKSRFPRLVVKEEFDFDIKLFGFEKFLRSIVHELLLNALESMGGLEEPKLDLSIREEDENLVFSVRDYGVGVDDKDYKKYFRIYYSTKSQTGVGLNLVQSLIQSNEGDIEFSSPKEGGLRVHVRLPLKCMLRDHSKK